MKVHMIQKLHLFQTNLRSITKTVIAALILTTALSGCVTNHEQAGTLTGGVVGGVVGNQFGKGSGRTAATIAGTLAGGFVGNQWGKSVDNAERARYKETENFYPREYRPEYQPRHHYRREERYHSRYHNDHHHYRQEERYHPRYHNDHHYKSANRKLKCRNYKSTVWMNGEPQKAFGKTCFIRGKWRIVD